jgi:DNA repair exonuclease SbcCD ATPase subunit
MSGFIVCKVKTNVIYEVFEDLNAKINELDKKIALLAPDFKCERDATPTLSAEKSERASFESSCALLDEIQKKVDAIFFKIFAKDFSEHPLGKELEKLKGECTALIEIKNQKSLCIRALTKHCRERRELENAYEDAKRELEKSEASLLQLALTIACTSTKEKKGLKLEDLTVFQKPVKIPFSLSSHGRSIPLTLQTPATRQLTALSNADCKRPMRSLIADFEGVQKQFERERQQVAAKEQASHTLNATIDSLQEHVTYLRTKESEKRFKFQGKIFERQSQLEELQQKSALSNELIQELAFREHQLNEIKKAIETSEIEPFIFFQKGQKGEKIFKEGVELSPIYS